MPPLIELAGVEEVYRMAIFPPRNVALACAGTVALALLIALLPIWPAVAFRPGDAVRYP